MGCFFDPRVNIFIYLTKRRGRLLRLFLFADSFYYSALRQNTGTYHVSLTSCTVTTCRSALEVITLKADSDVDIMILVDLEDSEIERFRKQLSWITYDFNEEYDTDMKPITKNEAHFRKWLEVYPFYTNVQKEGIEIYVRT